jgi:hypothetical protein
MYIYVYEYITRSSKTNRFLEYEHVGRTVMINDDENTATDVESLWIQGETGDTCPIGDLSPFMDSSFTPTSSSLIPSKVWNYIYMFMCIYAHIFNIYSFIYLYTYTYIKG